MRTDLAAVIAGALVFWSAAPLAGGADSAAQATERATPATLPAAAAGSAEGEPRHTWELRLLRDESHPIWPGQDEATAFPNLRQRLDKPLLVLRPADVESYVWSVQRITLRPEATQRLLAVHSDTELEHWWIPHYPFVVMVDGEFLYGGVFDDVMSQMSMDFPVIHAELVEDRAVLHLLPRQQSWGFDPRWEESTGPGTGLRAAFLAETAGFGDAQDEAEPDPVRDRFRPVLRDPRIRAVFEPLGVLAQAPPPPPDEAVLHAANRAVDAARAAAQRERMARQLADDYHLFYPLGYRLGPSLYFPMNREEVLKLFGKGWKPGRYAVLATQERVNGDEGIAYTLFYVRGKVDDDERSLAILARRRYRRAGTGWKLVREVHHLCFDDDPRRRGFEEPGTLGPKVQYLVTLDGPCWPPPEDEKEPPLPEPIEMIDGC